MQNSQDTEPMEVLPPSAIMQMEKAQIDVQVATAHQYPRSLEQFRKRALGMATLDEDTAESCIYCRPVGKEQNSKGQWVEKYAEGASIRLAEIVAASYGNIRVAARIIEQTDRFVRCEGVAHDLESNYAGKSECMESTVNKKGEPYSERQRALTAKVCLAKAYRDACFKVVPRALCKPVFEAAKKVAAGQGKPLEERRKKARAWISSIKIDEARVFAALGVQGWSEVTEDHLLKLTGLKTAISDGDETFESAFPPIETSQAGSNRPQATAHHQATQGALPATPTKAAEPPTKAPETPSNPPLAEQPPKTVPEEDNVPMDFPAEDPPEAVDPAKASINVPETTGGPNTPSAPSNEQAPGSPAAQPGKAEVVTPPQEPPVSNEPPDPLLGPEAGDTDSVASVKLLASKAGVNWFALRTFLLAKNLMRPEQRKLNELSATKLGNICKNFPKFLPDIRKLPRHP